MKKILIAVLLALAFGQAARAGSVVAEPTMYEAPTELSRLSARVDAVPGQAGGGGHSTFLTWILSTDDNTTACTTSANCIQSVYRASGTCAAGTFSLLTTTPLSAAAAQYTDSTVTPGVWCYGVTFSINGLESAKDTVAVTLQPAPPSGAAATTK